MKCPKCKRTINAQAKVCKHCGTRIVRKSDKLVSQITMSGRIAVACGFILIGIGAVIAFYGGYAIGAVTAGVGIALSIIGKYMG